MPPDRAEALHRVRPQSCAFGAERARAERRTVALVRRALAGETRLAGRGGYTLAPPRKRASPVTVSLRTCTTRRSRLRRGAGLPSRSTGRRGSSLVRGGVIPGGLLRSAPARRPRPRGALRRWMAWTSRAGRPPAGRRRSSRRLGCSRTNYKSVPCLKAGGPIPYPSLRIDARALEAGREGAARRLGRSRDKLQHRTVFGGRRAVSAWSTPGHRPSGRGRGRAGRAYASLRDARPLPVGRLRRRRRGTRPRAPSSRS